MLFASRFQILCLPNSSKFYLEPFRHAELLQIHSFCFLTTHNNTTCCSVHFAIVMLTDMISGHLVVTTESFFMPIKWLKKPCLTHLLPRGQGRCRGLNVARSCSQRGTSYSFFRHFCCVMHHLATMHSITDR